ncbi:hypothetical protein Tco_1532593 [Tanacetum coccineum]
MSISSLTSSTDNVKCTLISWQLFQRSSPMPWTRKIFTMEITVLIQAVPEAEGRPAVQQHTAIETVLNMTPENKENFQS